MVPLGSHQYSPHFRGQVANTCNKALHHQAQIPPVARNHETGRWSFGCVEGVVSSSSNDGTSKTYKVILNRKHILNSSLNSKNSHCSRATYTHAHLNKHNRSCFSTLDSVDCLSFNYELDSNTGIEMSIHLWASAITFQTPRPLHLWCFITYLFD